MTQRVADRLAVNLSASAAVAIAALAFACGTSPRAPSAEASAELPARMSEIVAALEVALPSADSPEHFRSPVLRAELAAALAALRRNASALEQHGAEPSPAFAFFSARLAEDAADVEQRFQEDRFDEARFLLQELTEDCVGCHLRLPDARPHPVGAAFAQRFSTVPPEARVRLQVAARQFEEALATCEGLLGSSEREGAALDLTGVIDGYLALAIRVRGDLPRAERGLASLAERSGLPTYLAQLLATWRAALVELAPLADAPSVANAREVLARADELRRYPADRSALVHDLVASSLLHRALAAGIADRHEAAEASYLLGLAELRNDPSRRLPQAEWYLESAVRSAPGSDVAQEAYALLEEQAFLSWSGSGGVAIPPDVEERLRTLRSLAERDGGP